MKAQVHAGGRGKAGGVKLAEGSAEAREHRRGDPRHDHQGSPGREGSRHARRGHRLRGVRRHHRRPREQARGVHGVSGGGVDIEEVAETNPDAIRKLAVDPRYGLLPHQAYWLATELYDDVKQQRAAAKIMQQLYDAFIASGASLAEINPLITTPEGEVKAIDAKMNIDDNELFRLPTSSAPR
jgi:succinyl-CoA synthetase beta subunit